jgi:cytochrome oxidase Cu insertion factor (SCO1/SenC/PrrC family)
VQGNEHLKVRWRTLSRLVIGAVILICIGMAAIATTIPRHNAAAPPSWSGTPMGNKVAPNFLLSDQNSRPLRLSSLRGKLVILTFFYTHCPDTCPLTAEKLRTIMQAMGPESKQLTVVAVSTDPTHDTAALAKRFLLQHGLPSWHFALGTYAQLRKVWKSYYVYAVSPSQEGKLGPTHTAGMYLINKKGLEQEYLADTTPSMQIENDIHIALKDNMWVSSLPTAPTVGALAPNFTLSTLTSSQVSLRRLRGKPVLVNFWATWCVPCRSEMPMLERTYRKYGGRISVLGVDEQEEAGAVEGFIRSYHVTYPIALDQSANVSYLYQLNGTPTSFLIDRRGVVRAITVGPLSGPRLQKEVRATLKAT